MNLVQRIVSGGQTGVDRAALDVAISQGIPHGGWCPRGRRSETGRIPARYRLTESHSPQYWVRTEQNVVDSDGTLILHRGPLQGGTSLTQRMARKHRRPCCCIDLASPAQGDLLDSNSGNDSNGDLVRNWLEAHAIQTLNVAGPRESSAPGITEEATAFLLAVFCT